jgi:hypothetical protein
VLARGFLYARAISGSVARLDRGVRAIPPATSGHRIATSERDQLGALALAFNDIVGEAAGPCSSSRATHQAVEHVLAIARDVQGSLFPDVRRTHPYSKPPACAGGAAP